MPRLEAPDFARLFGCDLREIEDHCREEITAGELDFSEVTDEESAEVMAQAREAIDQSLYSVSGPKRIGDWENGWQENLDAYRAKPDDPMTLVPRYYFKNKICRLEGRYIRPASRNFVHSYMRVYRAWLFGAVFAETPEIHEFGCGSCHHLHAWALRYPKRKAVGYDWAAPSVDILKEIARQTGTDVSGHRFNLFEPTTEHVVPQDAAVFTFGALEQLGDGFRPFIDFICAQKVSLCVHAEGIDEFYDRTDPFDALAYDYNAARGYLTGYFTELQAREARGDVEILRHHRQHFGDRFNDTFSLLIWRPL